MKTDKLITEDGFTYCCKAIPIKVIEVKNGLIYNKKTLRSEGQKVTLYKHYIWEGEILQEPVVDEDVYEIWGKQDE